MMDGLTVTFIRDGAGLAALAPEWWRLWQRIPDATPFQSPGWLIAWWRAFKPGALLTAAVHVGERLVGLAPFYLERNGPRTRLLPVGISISDYLDVLVDPAVQEPALGAIASGYAASAEPWEEWEMADLRPGASAFHIPAPPGFRDRLDPTVPCPVLSLPAQGRPETGLPPRMRRTLQMTRNRIEHHGAARVLSTGDRAMDWWVAQLWRLHQARWESLGEPGLLRDGRLEPFHLEAMPGLSSHDLLRLYALLLGEQVAGVYYGFRHGNCAYAYLGGFDPAFSYYSPGKFLLGHAVREAAADGACEMHFLRGSESYKYAWGVTERWNARRLLLRCPS